MANVFYDYVTGLDLNCGEVNWTEYQTIEKTGLNLLLF